MSDLVLRKFTTYQEFIDWTSSIGRQMDFFNFMMGRGYTVQMFTDVNLVSLIRTWNTAYLGIYDYTEPYYAIVPEGSTYGLPYSCTVCGKQFTTNDERLAHEASAHKPTTLYTCPICNATFTTDAELQSHKYTHGGTPTPTPEPTPTPTPGTGSGSGAIGLIAAGAIVLAAMSNKRRRRKARG